MAGSLVELDSLEVLVICDNEVDPLSKYLNEGVTVSNRFIDFAINSPFRPDNRGAGCRELRMEASCCGAHGLSLLLTATKNGVRKSMLFDTGPEEQVFALNAARLQKLSAESLKPDLSSIDLIHLSHWHRDHSGGMLEAIRMIKAAKALNPLATQDLKVDLHPDRPDYRGILLPNFPISLEADPSFAEIAETGGIVDKHAEQHYVLDDMFLVSGEIPRLTSYELGLKAAGRFDIATGTWGLDPFIMDERFVMCNVKDKGLVMFTGCSHAGVVNASRHAASLAPSVPLFAVVGGYHLADAEPDVIEVSVRDLKALGPKILLPGHCSGWRVKQKIEAEMPGTLAPSTVGTRFTF